MWYMQVYMHSQTLVMTIVAYGLSKWKHDDTDDYSSEWPR